MKRATVIGLITAALLSGLLPATSAQAAPTACSGVRDLAAVGTSLHTFSVEAEPIKKTYRIGEKMKVAMKVQRPGREDPLGQGQPIGSPHYLAAEGVEVSVALYVGEYHYRYGMGVTDANGEAVITIPAFPKDAPVGTVRATAAARAYYNRGGCPEAEEVGYTSYDPFFKATR